MTAEVHQLFASEAEVDRAWGCYIEKARLLFENPALICDRQFQEEVTRRHERWKKLFLRQEAGA